MTKEDHAIILQIFSELGEELADQVILKRASNKTVKPFCKYRAALTMDVFRKSRDVKRAAAEYVSRRSDGIFDQAYLKLSFDYDPDTGIFTRGVYKSGSEDGKIVGSPAVNGYLTIPVNGKSQLAHRLALVYVYNRVPEFLDHIDRNKTNNAISNLRECTLQQNNWNMTISPLNTSGITGVHWDSSKGKWMATIRGDGKTRYLGRYVEKDEALAAYEAAVVKYRGSFLGDVA